MSSTPRRPRSRRPSASVCRPIVMPRFGSCGGTRRARSIASSIRHRHGAARPGTLGCTRFIFPFHYMLHIRIQNIGYWLVGLAGMAMMALCVSGVIIHRKIFTDFFTFRPAKEAAPPDPRSAQRHRRAGPAIPFPDHPVRPGHLLGDLFPEFLAGDLQRRPAGVLCRRLRQRHPQGSVGGARRHGLVRRHGWRGEAPVGHGSALRYVFVSQSRRCEVGGADRPPRRGHRQQYLRRGLFRRADRRADQLPQRHGAGHERASASSRAFTSFSFATGACAGSISAWAWQAAC